MSIGVILRFLIGDRAAIQRIAVSRGAIWVGLLLVLSAGFPREYDGEDLLHQPWHLALPLGASLVTAFILYCLVVLTAWRRSGIDFSFLDGFVTFLAIYWMTAPFAWLYAIPYERFLSPAAAVQANLATLALVAAWRVLLITRVISVLFQCRFLAALMIVMLFADGIVITVLSYTPLPIVSIMGGVRLTESEQVLRDTACFICVWSYLTMPIWIIGSLIVIGWPRRVDGPWTAINEFGNPARSIHRSAWIASFGLLLLAVGLLPLAQGEQQLRRRVETALREENIADAIVLMSQHQRDDFPPHWDPPPRIGYGEQTPDLMIVLETLVEVESAPWVRAAFIDKLMFQQANQFYVPGWALNPQSMDDEQLQRYHDLLHQLDEGPAIAAAQRDSIENALDGLEYEEAPSQQRRDLLEALLELAGPVAANPT